MQDPYITLEFNKIRETLSEFCKSEVGKENALNLMMLDNKEELFQTNEYLKEMISLVSRFGPLPIKSSINCLKIINIAKKTGLLSPMDLYYVSSDVATYKQILLFLKKLNLARKLSPYSIMSLMTESDGIEKFLK
jgi:dsDNA-specific endonuclease/ATPase MutS2